MTVAEAQTCGACATAGDSCDQPGSMFAVILGHLAVSQIKRTGQGGRGLAIAGLLALTVGASIAGSA